MVFHVAGNLYNMSIISDVILLKQAEIFNLCIIIITRGTPHSDVMAQLITEQIMFSTMPEFSAEIAGLFLYILY